jgi:hypothetical protein
MGIDQHPKINSISSASTNDRTTEIIVLDQEETALKAIPLSNRCLLTKIKMQYTSPSIYAISLICEREILPSARYMRENFAVMRFCAVEHKVAGHSRTCCWRDGTRGSCCGIQEEGSFSLAVGIQCQPPFLEVNLDHLQQLHFHISDVLT